MRVLLIDGPYLAYRAYFAIPGLMDAHGRPSGALFGFLSALLRTLQDHPAEFVAVTWDPARTFRHDLSEAYKATREKMDQDLLAQLPWMEEAVGLLGIRSLQHENFESDDLMASLATQAAAAGHEAVLVAADKDLAQVVGEHVTLAPPAKGGEAKAALGPKEVEEKFGVPPAQMVDWQALVGDSSDNVKGIPGVGPKRATDLLKKYGDLDTALARGPEEEKGKLAEALAAHAADARLARRLVALRTDLDLGPIADLQRQPVQTRAMREFCRAHNFDSLLERFPDADAAGPEHTAGRDYRLVDTPQRLAELRRGLERSGGFAVDTETTGIDPVRARPVGISFSWEANQAWYVPLNLDPPLRGPGGESPIAYLAPVLADPRVPKYGQNAKYDLHVLTRAGAPVAGYAFDTMLAHFLVEPTAPHNLDSLAARYLGMKKIATEELIGRGKNQITMDMVPVADVARYACEDADATFQLVAPLRRELQAAGGEPLFHEVEMPLVAVLQRMEAAGVRVDRERLRALERQLSLRQAELEQVIFQQAGTVFNLNSPKQLGPILFERMRIQEQAGVKRVARTTSGYRTDAETLEQYGGVPVVDALLEFRQIAKLRGTYVEALPEYINPETGCIHTSYHQAVASTGRLSSADPNLQNIPIRSELGREIRRAFVPHEPGWHMVSADYSQIELRLAAHLAQEPALIDAFRENADIHRRTAALVFHVREAEVTPEMRARAKTINFGVLYGMGPNRLSRELGISFAEAKAFIDQYFQTLPRVRAWLDATLEEARRTGEVRTILGRRRPVPELQSNDGRVRAQAENVAVNTPLQGSAADLIKVAMIRVDARLRAEQLRARMLLQVHDELVFDCPPQELRQLATLAREEMEGVWQLSVPIRVDVGHGPDWASAH